MSGTKRKSVPVKEGYVKESKKAKIESAPEASSKSKKLAKQQAKAAPGRKQESSGSDEDDLDQNDDGGVTLGQTASNAEDNEEEVANGLHPDRVKAVAANSQSSKEAHAKQKQLANERKAAKPLAESLARTKKLWERLRRKSHVPLEERKQLVSELFELITGRMKDFVLKHDSVRVIQTAVKYANPEQKKLIARELAGSYRQLAESRYAKFLIGKLLVQEDDEIRDIIVPEFFGHVRSLIKHPEASWILDDVYRGIATRQQKATILREWYGAEFALFEKDSSEKASGDLADILAVDAGKRAPIMRSLLELINHLIQKKMTGFTLLHDAMLQYFLNAKAGTEEITDYLELIKGDEDGDLLKNLAFTKSGARVVCLALAYGTAKDRKQILKTYKDTFQLMATDPNGHSVILTAYEVIDDTKLTSRLIFPELIAHFAENQIDNITLAANNHNARITLLYLLQGRSKALLPSSHAYDLKLLAEIDRIRTGTSKKDPEIRRSELVKALSPELLRAVKTAIPVLVCTSFGCQFVTEVMFGAEGDKSATLATIAEIAAGDPTYVQPTSEGEEVENTNPPSHIATTLCGGKMLKALIAGGRYDAETKSVKLIEPPLNFADILYPHIKDHIVVWATGSSSFVPLALMESASFSKKDELLKILKENQAILQKAATEETAEQKAKRESESAQEAAGDKKKKRNKAKSVEGRKVGNAGSALLLELL